MAAAAMTSRVLLPFQAPQWHLCQSRRGMATLKELAVRLKSVKNIQKITKSMKMVSASKFARAERDLKQARVFGKGALSLYEKAEIAPEEKKPNHLIVAVSSDRGLCGGIHSNIAKNIKATIAAHQPSGDRITVVCVGDKVRTILQRTHSSNILMGFSELGKKPPTFKEASHVAQEVLNSGVEFESAEIVYNRFKTVISYSTTQQPVVPLTTLIDSEKMSIYDDLDTHVLQCYHEIALANLIFYAMKEGATSEQSSRMTAMDSASKNAGEMIDKLTLTYNRTRQAVITRELIEIISGAAAIA